MKKLVTPTLGGVVLGLSILICSCSQGKPGKTISLQERFDRYYQEWKDETYLSFHSDTGWFTSRPSFRGIVGLGREAIPLIKEKIKEDKLNDWKKGDFMLAYAVVEIYGWNKADFYITGRIIGEQGFCDRVLDRLENIEAKHRNMTTSGD